jgi:hypothetical protein
VGVVVNNSYAKRNLQALLELCEENDPREQSSYRHRNPDWGSRNQVPRGRESVGYDGADGDVNGGRANDLGVIEEFNVQGSVIARSPKSWFESL